MQKLDFQKCAIIVKQKFQTTVISLLSLLCLSCLLIFFWFKPELIQVNEISELIPDQGTADQNQAFQLQTSILFVRQSFQLASTSPALWPLIFSYCLLGIGLLILFYAFKQFTNISWRFLGSGIILGLGILIYTLPQIGRNQAIQLLTDGLNIIGVNALIGITILFSASLPQFIFKIGHAQTYSQSLKNWLLLGGFYMANILLSYGNSFLQWNLGIHIPPILFGTVALILFLWDNKRNELIRYGLGFTALATLFSWVSVGNDAGIAAWQQWTLICLITMSLLFPLFIISNFQTPIRQNLPVYKITHKAPRVPLTLMYVGVFILGIAWIFARNGSAMHQVKAALANQSGDIAWILRDKKQAEFNYQNALGHSKLNGQSSFRLANLALEAQDKEAAAYYLSTSQLKHPTDASFIGLANIFQQENEYFQALFTLQKANQLFPENLRIMTQLARTYESLQIADSARYFYRKTALNNPNNPLAQANILYAEKKYMVSNSLDDPAIHANNLAISLKNGTIPSNTPPVNAHMDPTGDLREWAYLYNSMLFFKGKQAVVQTKKWIELGYANTLFPELLLLDAWQDYYHDKPLRALEKLSLAVDADATGKLDNFKNIIDFWHKSMRMSRSTYVVKDLNAAQHAVEAYPFQPDLLQEAILILNANKKEKLAYEASLQAARWNEDIAVFQWIYALQALKIGEIDYAKEAMNHLFSLDQKLFQASKPIFEKELQKALDRQKF